MRQAIQGTSIVTLSHLFFCPDGPSLLMGSHEQTNKIDQEGSSSSQDSWPIMCTKQRLDAQCFDTSKGLAVVVVALASLVYTYRPAESIAPSREQPQKGYSIVDTEDAVWDHTVTRGEMMK